MERTSLILTLVAPDSIGQLQRRVEPAHLFDDLPGLEGQLVCRGKAEALEERRGKKIRRTKKNLCPVSLFTASTSPSPVSSQRLELAMERKSPDLRGGGQGMQAADPCLNFCQEQIALGDPLTTLPLGVKAGDSNYLGMLVVRFHPAEHGQDESCRLPSARLGLGNQVLWAADRWTP